MNHYTHFIGLLLKPSEDEIDQMKKEAEASVKGGQVNGEAEPAAAEAITNGN